MTESASVLVMGVAGCGKTTIGQRLAARLGAVFLDADDYHPPANVETMRLGQALTDADRWPWLARVGEAVAAYERDGRAVVLACSALKRAYRQVLGFPGTGRYLVELRLSREALVRRLRERSDHFFDPGLLDHQLATLEPADEGEMIAADAPVETVIDRVLTSLP